MGKEVSHLARLRDVVQKKIDKWRESVHIQQPTKAEQILYEFSQHPSEVILSSNFLALYDGSDDPQAAFRATVNRINDEIDPEGYEIISVSGWMLVQKEPEPPAE